MEKRDRQPRRALRLPVTFWRPGDEGEKTTGYSMNVSGGGMFVATWRPLPPNAAVELQVEHADRVVRTSARVMHAARYPAEFARVFKSGMGVRFARPDEAPIRSLAQKGQLLADRGGRRRFNR